jgi:tetratricopeptide (TPR) repeat protein
MEEAITADRAALEGYNRDQVPLDWAAAQNNLGLALLTLGERESGTEHLEEAVAAYGAALEERTRDRVPLRWAISMGDQGVAFMLLAERLGDATRAAAAVQQIEAAIVILRDAGDSDAADFKAQLTKAQALFNRLSRR